MNSRPVGRQLCVGMLRLLCLWALLAVSTPAFAQSGEAASALTPDQAKALSDLLQDPDTRDAIVQGLDKIANEGAEPPRETAPVEAPEPEKSIGRRIAETSQTLAEQFATQFFVFIDRLQRVPNTMEAVASVRPEVIWEAIVDLFMVMVTTIALFFILRRLAKWIYREMGDVAEQAGAARTFFIIFASVIIDALVVVLAWAAGYAIALTFFGEMGEIGIRQTLYLNAFLIVEMAKVLTRAVLSPAAPALRPVAVPDHAAKVLSNSLNMAISIVGYGHLLVVPIVNQNVSIFAGYGVSTVLSLLAIGILIWVLLSYRKTVAAWLLGERNLEQGSSLIRFLARMWHVPLLVYLVGLFIIVLARPGGVLIPVLIVTFQILGLTIAGIILNTLLKRAMKRGVHVPAEVTRRLPLLERRLNGFVPQILTVLRLVIIAAILALSFQLVGFFDLEAWMASEFGVQATSSAVSVFFILLMTFFVWLAISSWVDWRLNPDFGTIATARAQTLLSLLKNAVTIVLIVITIMFILSEVGVDIAPLIASAGVLGLAIGFGAQKMVQDIITGIFIQFENAINVGDVVTVGGTTGTVERLTIRSVSLRDLHGVFHIIPFSSVDMVSNFNRGFAYYVCDMGVAYRENIDDVKQAMLDGFAELRGIDQWSRHIIEELQWMGLQSFGDSAIVLRARIKTQPGQQFAVGRAYNAILKRIFDERGIEIPFPHQTIYFGEDRDGNAPPLQILTKRAAKPEAKPDAQAGSKPEPDPDPDPTPSAP